MHCHGICSLFTTVIVLNHCTMSTTSGGDIIFPDEIWEIYLDLLTHKTICGKKHRSNNNKLLSSPRMQQKHKRVEFRTPLVGVVGGEMAEPHSHPWMATLGVSDMWGNANFICGGSLISENFILTAAHCAVEQIDVIRLGHHVMNDSTDVLNVKVKSKIIPNGYTKPYLEDDIALIELQQRIRFTQIISPICIPSPDLKIPDGSLVITAGWGSLRFGGSNSNVLQEVRIRTINNSYCEQMYGNSTIVLNFRNGFNKGILCAGARSGGRDACQGDSGGPLQYYQNGKVFLVGVVSAGKGCGAPSFPGIYTRISHYLDFIKSQADFSITMDHF